MLSFEIYWDDLTDEAKTRFIKEGFKTDDNIDLSPLAIVDIEE